MSECVSVDVNEWVSECVRACVDGGDGGMGGNDGGMMGR